MITFKLDSTRLERKMQLTIDAAKDLREPFREFGAYLRKKADAKIKGQAFLPLAKETIEARLGHRYQNRLIRTLENKLNRDKNKAIKRGAKQTTIARKIMMLQEFRRWTSLGTDSTSQGSAKEAIEKGLKTTTLRAKDAFRLKRRIDKQTIGEHPILGKMANTLKVEALKTRLRVYSVWSPSKAHNEGLTVGHGAKLPKREFLHLDPEDMDVLKDILSKHIHDGWSLKDV